MNPTKPSLITSFRQGLISFWSWIIEPKKKYQNPVLADKSRILSVFLLLMILVYATVDLISFNYAKIPLLYYLAYFLMVSAFLINRFLLYFLASRLTAILVSILIFISVFSQSAFDPERMLSFLVLGVILSSFLIRKSGVLIVGILNTLLIVIFSFYGPYPEIDLQDMISPLAINISASILIIAYMAIRDSSDDYSQVSIPQSEVNFNTIVNNSPLGIIISGGRPVISEVNSAACSLLGFSKSELIGKKIPEFVHEDDRDKTLKMFLGIVAEQAPSFAMEVRIQKKNGQIVWVNMNSNLVFDDTGFPVYGIAILEDITQRKISEEILQESERDLKEAQQIANLGNWLNSTTDNVVKWSDQIYKIFGYEPDTELTPNQILTQHIHPDDQGEYFGIVSSYYLDNDRQDFSDIPFRIISKDGELKHLSTSGKFIRDKSGNKISARGTLLDITKIRQAEEELRDSKNRFEIVFENSPLGILVIARSNQILQANPTICQMLGYSLEEILQLNLYEITHPEDRKIINQKIREIIKEGLDSSDLQLRLVTKVGDVVWINYNGAILRDLDGEIDLGIGILENITMQRYAQHALQESIETFRGFMEQSTDGIMLTDPAGKITVWSKGMEKNTGIPPEKALGQFVWDIQIQFPPEHWRSKGNKEEFKARFDQITKDFASNSGHLMPDSIIQTETGELKSVQVVTFPIQTEKGVLVGSIHRDVTEQKQAQEELKELMVSLDRSNKELEQFAYIASHDLQEPLRKIQTFGDRLISNYLDDLDDRASDFLIRMQDAANRGQKMVEALLLYSRVTTQGKPFAKSDLNHILKNVLSDLEVQIESQQGDVQVEELPSIECDPTQMHQLFQNLISNALKFHKSDQAPFVQVECRKKDLNHVEITVTDQGIGFDESYSDQIFQPFQRLHGHSEYEGSGIGLSICKKIVERHGGRIDATSQPAKGSIFTIKLPINSIK